LRQEVFFLAYHLHWGHDEVLGLPTAERWAFVKQLGEQLEREGEALKKSRRR